MEEELKKWGETTSEYFQQTAHDVKEIMLIVAETTQALGERDQRYARQFDEFAGQLAAIGNLEDLTKVRQSLGKSAQQLKSCVERMVQDGEQSVSKLRAELSVYQSRLDEVERVATQDPVTGVANRYKAERQIQLRIERARNLSIAIFDLDNFKQTNDLYGHPAGDALLKQFATELRTFFRSTDIVSRWGGDEFLVIVDCSAERGARSYRAGPKVGLRRLHHSDRRRDTQGERSRVGGHGFLAAGRDGRRVDRARRRSDVPGESRKREGDEIVGDGH